MIENDAQLQQATEQLHLLYRALAQTRSTIEAQNAALFSVLAEGPLAAIESLQMDIDLYTGKVVAIENQAEVWLRVVGPRISWPFVRTSVITKFLNALNKGVYTVGNFLSEGNVSADPLKRACDLNVVSLLPGSLRIGVKLPEPVTTDDTENRYAEGGLVGILRGAEWVGSDKDAGTLKTSFPDRGLRRVVLSALKSLVPPAKGGVDYVELSGRKWPSKIIRLNKNGHERIEHALADTLDEKVVHYDGILREIDLDGPSFTLRQSDAPQIVCIYPESMEALVKKAVDMHVRVSGWRNIEEQQSRLQNPVTVTQLDIIGENKPSSDAEIETDDF